MDFDASCFFSVCAPAGGRGLFKVSPASAFRPFTDKTVTTSAGGAVVDEPDPLPLDLPCPVSRLVCDRTLAAALPPPTSKMPSPALSPFVGKTKIPADARPGGDEPPTKKVPDSLGDAEERKRLEAEINDPLWLKNANSVLKFVEKHNTFPRHNNRKTIVGHDNKRRWVQIQIKKYKSANPPRDAKVQWLETIPQWGSLRAGRCGGKDMERELYFCDEVIKYVEEHGIPPYSLYRNAKGENIGGWVTKKAYWIKSGCLDEETLALVRRIPMIEHYAALSKSWKIQFRALMESAALSEDNPKRISRFVWFLGQLERNEMSPAEKAYLRVYTDKLNQDDRDHYRELLDKIPEKAS